MSEFKVGDAVRVERDETLYPSRGTWPRYRNRPGFVVMVNREGGPSGEPEYGVILTTTRPPWRQDAPGQLSYDSGLVNWFRPHELRHRREG
jgi:hypothetical protein